MIASAGEPQLFFENLDGLQEHLNNLYGARNAEYLSSPMDCVALFAVGTRDLRQALRADDDELQRVAVARLGSRIFPFTQLSEEPLLVREGLEVKYPILGCSYCGSHPCQCGETRGDANLAWDEVGLREHWSLSRWQREMDFMYGDHNRERGISYVTGRLDDELVEVMALEHFAPRLKSDELRSQRILELADLTAWTLGIGNVLGIDVQEVVEERYGDGCATCSAMPCVCAEHDFDHVYDILN